MISKALSDFQHDKDTGEGAGPSTESHNPPPAKRMKVDTPVSDSEEEGELEDQSVMRFRPTVTAKMTTSSPSVVTMTMNYWRL